MIPASYSERLVGRGWFSPWSVLKIVDVRRWGMGSCRAVSEALTGSSVEWIEYQVYFYRLVSWICIVDLDILTQETPMVYLPFSSY